MSARSLATLRWVILLVAVGLVVETAIYFGPVHPGAIYPPTPGTASRGLTNNTTLPAPERRGAGPTHLGVPGRTRSPASSNGSGESPPDHSTGPNASGPPAPTEFGYFEKTYDLPEFNPLTPYLKNANGLDTQIPTLVSDTGQPVGIYYVDNVSNLDLLSLSNGSVRTIAHVTLLYQCYGYDEMLDNEFFVEYGTDTALFFGTLTNVGTTYSIELVNLTSGAVALWNTPALVDRINQEAVAVGNNTVVVFSSNGSAEAYNLASHERWSAGTLPFFEANNVYWLPQKQQFVDVEASGALADQVAQLNVSRDDFGRVHLSDVATIVVDHDVGFNWVNGIGYNASADEIAFAAGNSHESATYTIRYAADGLLNTSGEAKWLASEGSQPLAPTVFDGQRYVYTSDYVLGSVFNGSQYLFDPWNGSTVVTDRGFLSHVMNPCSNACFEATYGPSVDYLLDVNATEDLGVPFSHVVYAYRNASDPFPPGSVPLAPTTLRADVVGPSSATLEWDLSGNGSVTRNSVYWFGEPACEGTHLRIDLASSATSYAFSRGLLESDTTYSSFVTSWNVVGESDPSNCVTFTTGPPPRGFLVFSETGLVPGTEWTVTVDPLTLASASDTIVFQEFVGMYFYEVGTVFGYATGEAGSVTLSGTSALVHVVFLPTGSPAEAGGTRGASPSAPASPERVATLRD